MISFCGVFIVMQNQSQLKSRHNKFSRPKFLNLFTLAPKMSITAKISILHRISGVLLFLSTPFLLYILHNSLVSPDFYTVLYGYVTCPLMKMLYLVLIWALMYHSCSGVRFLFLDIHKGIDIKIAKFTAYIVFWVSLILTVVLGLLIWGVV